MSDFASEALTVLALNFIQLTGPNNQTIDVNPDSIVSLRPHHGDDRPFHKEINCVIYTSDGKFVGVIEDCETVFLRLQGAKPPIPEP
jgi:hypothetical protein